MILGLRCFIGVDRGTVLAILRVSRGFMTFLHYPLFCHPFQLQPLFINEINLPCFSYPEPPHR